MRRADEQPARTLPTFKDEAEAAAFWDTHSPLDYPEEFQEVETSFARPLLKRGLTIKLSADTIAQLRQLASEKGIGPTTLARMWILEHLREETKQRSHTGTT